MGALGALGRVAGSTSSSPSSPGTVVRAQGRRLPLPSRGLPRRTSVHPAQNLPPALLHARTAVGQPPAASALATPRTALPALPAWPCRLGLPWKSGLRRPYLFQSQSVAQTPHFSWTPWSCWEGTFLPLSAASRTEIGACREAGLRLECSVPVGPCPAQVWQARVLRRAQLPSETSIPKALPQQIPLCLWGALSPTSSWQTLTFALRTLEAGAGKTSCTPALGPQFPGPGPAVRTRPLGIQWTESVPALRSCQSSMRGAVLMGVLVPTWL